MDFQKLTDTASTLLGRIFRGDIRGLKRLLRVNSMFHPKRVVWNFSHVQALFETTEFESDPTQTKPIPTASKSQQKAFSNLLDQAGFEVHKTKRSLTAFLAIHNGKIVSENYFQGTQPDDLRIGWSVSKGLIAILVGALIKDKQIKKSDLDAPITPLIPALIGTGYDGVTLRNLLNMSSGVAFNEDYIDYHSDINKLGRILGIGGSMDAFAATLVREYTPGTWRHYVSIDSHVIGMTLRELTGQTMQALYQNYLITPMRFERAPLCIRDTRNQPFVLGGFNFCTRDYGRIGLMMANGGKWHGTQIVTQAWVNELLKPSAPPPYPAIQGTPDAQSDYGMHWWRPAQAQPGEFFAIGIYGQMIYVNRKSNLVLVQNAADLNFRDGDGQVCLDTLALFREISMGMGK